MSVVSCGVRGIARDLVGDALCRRLERAVRPARRAVPRERHVDPRASRHLLRELCGHGRQFPRADDRLHGAASEPHIVVLCCAAFLAGAPLQHLIPLHEAAARILARHLERHEPVADARRPLIGELFDLQCACVEHTRQHPQPAQGALRRRLIEGGLHAQEL